MHIRVKSLIIGVVVAVGVWCLLWNPVEYLDRELGTWGLTLLGLIIIFISWRVWRKRVF